MLQFDPAADVLPGGKRLSEGISAAMAVGRSLWLAHDETVAIERLVAIRTGAASFRYQDHRRFNLGDLLSLPASATGPRGFFPEADLEGISFGDDYLWLAGSHSALRDGVKDRKGSDAIAGLARVRRSGNRFLLARIPVSFSTGEAELVRECTTSGGRTLRAARLPGGKKDNALTQALRHDPHLGPFVGLPSKDNGLDVEGLAAAPGGRLFLGLRGPVLDGWACVLEIRVGARLDRDGRLTLRNIERRPVGSTAGAMYRKHFLDLGGAGIRDLCLAGRDLVILTGPAMRGKGASQVRRWKNALANRGERLVDAAHLPILLALPYGEKREHAEGITVVARSGRRVWLMVIYDSAGKRRRLPPAGMLATLHELLLPP